METDDDFREARCDLPGEDRSGDTSDDEEQLSEAGTSWCYAGIGTRGPGSATCSASRRGPTT